MKTTTVMCLYSQEEEESCDLQHADLADPITFTS